MRTRFVLLAAAAAFVAQAAFAGPKIEHWVAPSGAQVYFVENHDLPIVDVEIDFAVGTADDPDGKAGVASLTQGLLDLGAGGLDETELANRLADLGAVLSSGVDMDRTSVRLRVLSAAAQREPAVALMRTVLSAPQFPPEVVEREKARSIAALKEALTRPEAIAGKAFWTALYPAHAYGRQATPESVAAIERGDLTQFHQRHFAARNATVSLVGDLARADAEALAQQLTEALPAATAAREAAREPTLPARAEKRIAHPAAQAHVLIGLPALKRGDPDFFPLVVGNNTLGGGGFVSRLMKEVRETRGLAYSVQSYFMPMRQAGPFEIALQTRKTQVGDALKVVRDVLGDFLANGPSEAELAAAKQNLVGSFPLRLDSNRKILDHVAMIGFYGLPLDYLEHYAANIDKVTVADVKAAFARHVKPGNLVTVVVGAE